MSSAGQAVGAVVGGVIGFISGGPAGAVYGAQAGMMVGGLIDPPKGPTINGPRLSDLSAQTSTYGSPIPRIYGTVATHGNVIWLQGNKLTEVVRKEKQGGKGGGGGATVKTYSYYATFAVGLADVSKTGPIQGVRRIWVGGNLIYDAGGDDLETIIASNQAAQGFRIYFGDENQQPDPRMQADLGVANCPAYRGLAYIVFYDFALKDYGNSLMAAQVKVEVVSLSSAEPSFFAGSYSIDPPDNLWELGACTKVDTDGTCTFYERQWDVGTYPSPSSIKKTIVYPFGGKSSSVIEIPYAASIQRLQSPNGYAFLANSIRGFLVTGGLTKHYIMGSGEYTFSTSALYAECSAELYGLILSTREVCRYADVLEGTSTTNASLNGTVSVPGAYGIASDGEYIYAISESKIYHIDPTSFSVVDTVAYSGIPEGVNPYQQTTSVSNGVLTVVSWQRVATFYVSTGEPIVDTTLDAGTLYYSGSSRELNAAVLGEVLYFFNYKSTDNERVLSVFMLNSSSSELVQLEDIIHSECLQSGILSLSDIDATDIDQDVRGYRIAQTGAIRGALEPLQGAWPFDVIQAGYKIKFVRRGKTSIATIDASELDARQADSGPGVQITLANEMDTQLPRAVSLKYLDIGREYDLSEQNAERLNTDAVNLREMEMPIVLSATEAAGMSEVLLYLYWLERRDVSFRLPPEYRYLEPADVITITGEWGQYELRLTRINLESDGRLACSAKFNSAAIYTPTAQGAEGEAPPQTIPLDGPSQYIMLDVPLLSDSYNSPGWPAAMAGYTNGWPGGVIYRSVDGGQTWTDLQGFTSPVTMGYARGALGAGRFDIVDSSGVLDVDMMAGDLSSIDELAQFAGGNALAYGAPGRWEICSPRTVTLNADGSLRMTDWLRGRFGTEWAASLHQSGDALVLLTDPDLAWVSMESGAIGLARDYRGITAGRSIDTDTNRSETYSGVNLKPLSPVYLNGSRHPSTRDWSLSWTRRGRVSPDWRSSVDVPLGEASESYEVEIYDGSGYANVKRTLTASTPAAAYTSAQQVTDFGANQGTLYVRVYQLSATVGRGFALTTSITRG